MSDPTGGAAVPTPEPTPPNLSWTAETVTPQPLATAPTAVGTRRVGKVRNPWAVWIFSIITLGIYMLYWYFKVNDEQRKYNPSIEVSPGIATLAIIIPIAGLISFWNFGGRLNRMEESAGSSTRTSPIAGLLLQIFILGTGVVYYQMQLNRIWALHGNQPEGTAV